ncbi:MAG: hypothetical protein K0R03_2030 [Moraxellaceae bacterium]|jgi:uncharacterized protein (UPF0276 family)|nr:hypothetical protein [Moraxellaceae bacterium]
MSLQALPSLGIGVSLSLSSQPDPVELVRRAGGPRFVEYAGLAEVDSVSAEVARIRAAGVPVLFHPSYINFCGSFANSAAWLAATAEHVRAVASPWFAQDCAYCFWEQGPSYSTQLGYFVPPILNEASLQLAVQRVREVQAAVPVPVAVEPPPMAFAVGGMPLFEFFGRLARQTGCALLLDMGHLVSWEMATGRRVLDAIAELPVENVVELHIAGGRLRQADDGPVYMDMHEAPVLPETWRMLDDLLPRLPAVKALCYECEGLGEEAVLAVLAQLREKVRLLSGSAALKAAAGGAP